MSCMKKIDPYNNIPPRKNGQGGPSGSQNYLPASQSYNEGPSPGPVPNLSFNPPMPQNTVQMSQYGQQAGQRNLQTENMMLHSDLQTAIQYIYQLGGKWPPPGK